MKGIANIILLFFFSLSRSYGQFIDVTHLYPDNQYFFPDFEYLGEDAGFTQQRISCLLEDHEGYVWVGTREGGLFRYDGYEFESFPNNLSDPYSLQGSQIYFVFEDSRNLLWIGTNKALCIYDRLNKRFITFPLSSDLDAPDTKIPFICMTEDDRGNLYIGRLEEIIVIPDSQAVLLSKSEKPISLVDELDIKVIDLVDDRGDFPGGRKQINDMLFDKFGNLWVIIWGQIGTLSFDTSIIYSGISGKEKRFKGIFSTLAKGNLGFVPG